MIRIIPLLLLLSLIGTGFLSVSADDTLSIPDLLGNWTGTSEGYHSSSGYFHSGDYQYVLAIKSQEGRVFNGTLIVTGLDPYREYPLSGIIAPDRKSFHIAEHGTGIDYGYLISPDKMELVLLVNDPDNFSVLCSLERDK